MSKNTLLFYLLIALITFSYSQSFSVDKISPDFNEIVESKRPVIDVIFNQPFDSSTITNISFSVFGERSGYHQGDTLFDLEKNIISFLPLKDFIAGEQVIVSLSKGVKAVSGDSLKGFTWLFRIPSQSVALNFSDPVTYNGGGVGMQCIDMDNDGSPDIITSSGEILLNNKNGQFTSNWILPEAYGGGKIATGDLNKDGLIDVLYNTGNNINIGISDGIGNFAISANPNWFYNFVVADFNGDGYSDIAGINQMDDTSSTLSICFNNVNSIFTDTTIIGHVGGLFKDLTLSDIDNDGDLDIIIVSQLILKSGILFGFEGIIIFRNEGDGKFLQPELLEPLDVNASFPEFINAADFNNDGYSDISVMGGGAGYVCLNLENGIIGVDSSSIRRFWGPEALSPFSFGDINGDNWIDIVLSGYSPPFELNPLYSVITNCNSIFFHNCNIPNFVENWLPSSIYCVLTADLDNDDDLDIVHSGEAVFVSFQNDTITSINNKKHPISDFSLNQNYPNPFNSETTISYYLPVEQRVNISIYNILGEQINKLKDEIIAAGEHKLKWNGLDKFGMILPTGIYFIRLKTPEKQKIIKTAIIK